MSISPILPYRVIRNDFITSNVIHMDCVPMEGNKPAFKAGQFMMLHWRDAEGKLIDKPHSFSIASAPHEQHLSFAIKIYGPYTTRLSKEVPAGSIVHFQGPYGIFTLEKISDDRVVLLAGGVGIAPFRGFLYDELHNNTNGLSPATTGQHANATNKDGRRFHILYSNKTKTTFPYKEELDAMVGEHPDRLRVAYTVTQELDDPSWTGHRGRWDAQKIRESVKDCSSAQYLVCGPPMFVTEMQEQLAVLGVPKEKVKIEKFI